MLVVAGRPLIYLLTVVTAVTLSLVGYIITARRDQPYRRIHAVLCLLLNRSYELEPLSQSAPRSEHHES